mmetsp:Transcript_17230/g.31216  ORF Transcript_17230/g.31216 Transcript_17230/m.31216 type:complete len:125 (-) Transcript_17230:439-813(-)
MVYCTGTVIKIKNAKKGGWFVRDRCCLYEDDDIEDISLAQLHDLLKLANKAKESVDGQVENTPMDRAATISKDTEEEAAKALSNLMALSPVEQLNNTQCQRTMALEDEEDYGTDSSSERTSWKS